MRSEQTTPRFRRRIALVGGLVAVAALALSACTSTTDGEVSQGSPVARNDSTTTPAAPSTSQTPGPAVITLPAKLSNVSPAAPVSVTVVSGTITDVTLINPAGKHVQGALATDGSSWAAAEVLGYSKAYKLTVHATGTDGTAATKKATITTVTPSNFTMPYLNTTGGLALDNGAKYGVGIIPVVNFDEPITDRAAAERSLEVVTTPHVEGVWSWVDAQHVQYRPETYWKPGTKVTVRVNVYGVNLGGGLYGQSDTAVSFKIGAKHVAVADDTTHMVKVYFSGKRVRTMPTSMGEHLYVDGINGQKVSLWTMQGTYTVIGHEDPATMSSASFGLPANSPYGYAPEKVYKATKISTDGIYMHSAPWSVWAQGHSDQSHGCLNLSPADATWYYEHSTIGDVVVVKNPGAPKIQIWQNGGWSVPWSTWVKGSALH